MADEDNLLEEAMEYLKEAGQRIRATQSLIRSQGKLDDADYRELDLRLQYVSGVGRSGLHGGT
jgi:hypothetical protein